MSSAEPDWPNGDAEQARKENEQKQREFYANREKLKALRLARDRGTS